MHAWSRSCVTMFPHLPCPALQSLGPAPPPSSHSTTFTCVSAESLLSLNAPRLLPDALHARLAPSVLWLDRLVQVAQLPAGSQRDFEGWRNRCGCGVKCSDHTCILESPGKYVLQQGCDASCYLWWARVNACNSTGKHMFWRVLHLAQSCCCHCVPMSTQARLCFSQVPCLAL